EVPYGVVDKVAKLIPEGPGQTLDACLKPGQPLKQEYDADPTAREIVDLAKPLEGLTRQDSIHAAAVVIGAQPLTDIVPLQQKGADQEVVTQFAGNDIEALGLLKMDFLGLRNLDVLEKARELVGNGTDWSTLPLDDKKVYEMLAKGDATGVFQFESSGMREALRQVKPTVFEDLIALVALYRPGPMGYIPVYARREQRVRLRRAAALEGHRSLAGLLVQQVARRVLRTDRVPHRVHEGAPPARVHGGADLLRDEHEGPRPVLCQRVRRDGDRRAAAGR